MSSQMSLTARLEQHSNGDPTPSVADANTVVAPLPSLTGNVNASSPSSTSSLLAATGGAAGSNSSRKRRSDAEAVLAATHVARKVKLTDKDATSLSTYSKYSAEDQLLVAIGLGLKTLSKLNSIQPSNTLFVIPELLKTKVEVYVRNALFCPTTTGYRDDLVRTVMDILRANPAWGLTREVQENECHSKVVHDRVSLRATEKRRAVKVMIGQSVGTAVNPDDPRGHRDGSMDIITLVKNITGLKDTAIFKTQDVSLTVQMLAHFSLLRLIFLESQSTHEKRDYWVVVDKHLKDIRNRYKNKPKATLSAFFKGILDDDLQRFGEHPDIALDDLDSATISRAQRETEDAMGGAITVFTDDEDGEAS